MLLTNMTMQQTNRSTMNAASAKNIEEQLIPILKELLTEIKKKAIIDGKWAALDKSLETDLSTYVQLAANVRNSLMRQQWKGDSSNFPDVARDCPKDPWIANLALQKHIAACYKKQEGYRKQLIDQEEDFAAFEAVIIQNVKVSLATFYEWRHGNFSQQIDATKYMQDSLTKLHPEQDWDLFKYNNQDRFLVVPSAFVQVNQVCYDGYDDPGVTIVKQGRLLRKEGVFKRAYKPMTVVLTHSSYLHVFPELEKGQSLQTIVPESSIDLTDCILNPLMMNEKEPEEIALVGRQGMFGRDVKYKFRGDTMAESADWWGSINEQMKKYSGTRNLPTKVADEHDLPSAGSDDAQRPKPLSAEQLTTTSAANPSANVKRQSISPPTIKQQIPQQQLPPRPSPAVPVTASYSAPPPPPIVNEFNSLSLAEQMELKLQSKSQVKVAAEDLNVPQFEAVDSTIQAPIRTNNTTNPWDSYQADDGGW